MKTKLFHNCLALILLAGFVLSACNPQSPNKIPTETLTATLAPTASPTITVTPSPTPRPEPVLLTLDNISNLQEIYHAGNGTLRAAKLSPDGQQIAISSDGTGLALHNLDGTQSKVLCELAFNTITWSQDGSLIIGARGNKIWVIDAATGEEKNSFTVEKLDISGLDLSVDGVSLAVGSSWESYIYDWTTAAQIKDISADWNKLVSFSQDGKFIAGPSTNDNVLVIDTITGKVTLSLGDNLNRIGTPRRVLWSPDGKLIAILSKDGYDIFISEEWSEVITMRVRIWDTQSGEIKSIHEIERGEDIQWLSNTELAILSTGIQILDLENDGLSAIDMQLDPKAEKDLANLKTMHWSKDRSTIIVTTTDSVKIWAKTEAGITQQTSIEYSSPVEGFTWLGDNKIGFSDYAGKVHIWDFLADENKVAFEMGFGYNQQAWSPDGSFIATNNYLNFEKNSPFSNMLWKVPSGEGTKIASPSDRRLMRFTLLPEGTLIGQAGIRPSHFYIVNTKDGSINRDTRDYNPSLPSLGFSPDASKIAFIVGNNISIRDAATDQEIANLKGHKESIRSAMWSPSGKFLASWGNDKQWIVWNTSTFQQLATNTANDFGFNYWISLDGNDYLLGYKDNAYLIFDPTTLENTGTIAIPYASIFSVSPNGRYVAASGEDGVVRIWAVLP
jgi:WD40 repeat protein